MTFSLNKCGFLKIRRTMRHIHSLNLESLEGEICLIFMLNHYESITIAIEGFTSPPCGLKHTQQCGFFFFGFIHIFCEQIRIVEV